MPFALTFDDGPGPSMPNLLDVLRDADVRATFFVLGRNIEEPSWDPQVGPEQARAMVVRAIAEGHEIANHSYSHSRDPAAPRFMAEVPRMDDLIRDLRREAGADPDSRILIRLPYGEQPRGDHRAAALRAVGRNPIHWTSIVKDWVKRHPRALLADMVAEVRKHDRTTAVLTMHASGESAADGLARPWTVEAVRLFLIEAKREGWQSVACPDSVPFNG